MGAAAVALLAAAAAAAAVSPEVARADACTGVTARGGRFATCFDPGNRLAITAGTNGFGGGLALRHIVNFDDEPDLVWKLEHGLLEATHAALEDRFDGVIYRGRFIRHARDGHLVIPLGTPKKIFLPFDVGALAEVGAIRWRPGAATRVGVVKLAPLIDVARSRDFRRRFAIGPVARWDVDLARAPVSVQAHAVAPFSTGLVNLHLESATGRLVGDLRVEAGAAWHNQAGWVPEALAEATVERIVLAFNDRPVSLVVGLRYATATDETLARIGASFVLFQRRDPRVRLD